jgi:trimeric autotransporter adhesin
MYLNLFCLFLFPNFKTKLMKTKTTAMKFKMLGVLIIAICFTGALSAQVTYCSPTFTSGCTTWSNKTITLDTINWTLGSTDCSLSDYTTMRTTVVRGVAKPMTVTNASWCGIGVWVDFNHDGMFDTTENLYHMYTAAAIQTYNFNVTVPAATPIGTYRMRVIAGWGSDCYGTGNTNGYGSCGAYTYGNFDDFTLGVVAPPSGAGVVELTNNDVIKLSVLSNPDNNFASVLISGKQADNATISITDITGKLLQAKKVTSDNASFDTSSLANGMYFITYTDAKQRQVVKMKK